MTALIIAIPGVPPSVNRAYRNTAGGGKRRTTEVVAWQTKVGQVVSNAAIWAEWHLPEHTPFTVAVALTAPRPYAFDADNCLKLCLDAVVLALDLDDRYIVALTVTKARAPEAATRVTVAAVAAVAER